MSKLPYMPFYVGDWLKDPAVSICAPATRGVWIDLLCAMHESDRSGELRGTPEQLSRIARCSTVEFAQALTDLQTTGTADVTERNGICVISNRRMKRDLQTRDSARKRQAEFREKGGGLPHRWTAIRAIILVRDNFRCAYCKKRASTVDHVIPRSKGGDDDHGNLVASCKGCNFRKGNRTPAEAGIHLRSTFDISVLNSTAASSLGARNNSVTATQYQYSNSEGMKIDEIDHVELSYSKTCIANYLRTSNKLKPQSDANRKLIAQACLLAEHDVSEHCLHDSVEAVLKTGPDDRFAYFRTCFVNAAIKEGLDQARSALKQTRVPAAFYQEADDISEERNGRAADV